MQAEIEEGEESGQMPWRPLARSAAARAIPLLLHASFVFLETRIPAAKPPGLNGHLEWETLPGMESVRTLRDKTLLRAEVEAFLSSEGPSMLVAKIQALGRGAGPRMDGQENKYKFVRHVERIAQIEILGAPKP